MKSYSACAVILCAGTGSRTNLGYNKILHCIGKKTVLEMVLDSFENSLVNKTVLVINPADRKKTEEIAARYKNIDIVNGGDTRTESVRNGLKAAVECDIAVIHDGARPYASAELINRTVESALKYGSGIAAVKTTDTVKESDDGEFITASLDRSKLYNIQTPQSFNYKLINSAYEEIEGNYTDDSEVYALAGYTPRLVEGEYGNIKITTSEDLFKGLPCRTKIGIGYDVHRLAAGRKLILGGVDIPHDKGLLGHSDADVLIHAITDAILSAAGLPDIGVMFPDSDPATEGISSLILLDRAMKEVLKGGYTVNTVSAVIMAQKPKLGGYIPNMRKTISSHLGIPPERINISATTTEKLGIVGKEKGIASSASCLLNF